MHVLFRVDAYAGIGIGHLQRCLSLAYAFAECGHESSFLCNDEPANRERIERAGYSAHLSSALSWSTADAQSTRRLAVTCDATFVVVDSDLEGADFLRSLKDPSYLTVAIEDIVKHDYPVDVLINGDAHGALLEYETEPNSLCLLGPQYAILHPDFWALEPQAPKQKVHRILLTTGGGDRYGLMPHLLMTVASVAIDAEIDVIVGPFFEHGRVIAERANSIGDRVRLVEAPDGLLDYIATADIAVAAGGQTLYELARVGCPTVAFTIADNQEIQTRAFADAGTLIRAGSACQNNILSEVAIAIGRLVDDPDLRKSQRISGMKFIDGGGACRLVEALIRCVNTKESLAHA